MLTGGQAKQQSVVILLESEEIDLRGVRQQRTIVIVYIAVYIIIGGVETSDALQQFHL